MACARCRNHEALLAARARARFDSYPTRCRAGDTLFLVEAAELLLELAPRDPVVVTARSLDQHFRHRPWTVARRHLPHVDPGRPGIMATITNERRPYLELVEGHHRATVHRRDRTDWTCWVLTPRESYAIMAPLCRCHRGAR